MVLLDRVLFGSAAAKGFPGTTEVLAESDKSVVRYNALLQQTRPPTMRIEIQTAIQSSFEWRPEGLTKELYNHYDVIKSTKGQRSLEVVLSPKNNDEFVEFINLEKLEQVLYNFHETLNQKLVAEGYQRYGFKDLFFPGASFQFSIWSPVLLAHANALKGHITQNVNAMDNRVTGYQYQRPTQYVIDSERNHIQTTLRSLARIKWELKQLPESDSLLKVVERLTVRTQAVLAALEQVLPAPEGQGEEPGPSIRDELQGGSDMEEY